MMKTLRSPLMHTNFPISSTANTAFLIPLITKTKSHLNHPKRTSSSSPVSVTLEKTTEKLPGKKLIKIKPLINSELPVSKSQNEFHKVGSNLVFLGAVTVGVALFLTDFDDDQKALAFGPEGPIVEEFWDNMGRYALYVLTVSTGVAYTVFQPILELLRNPISAILVLAIFGGSIYIMTQVLSAMVGVSDFSYDCSY